MVDTFDNSIFKQEYTSLTSLIRNFYQGELLPAKFQRNFVWTKDDVIRFGKSLYLGIPIGSFLIWEPEIENFDAKYKWGNAKFPAIVIDGQHRLFSLMYLFSKNHPIQLENSPWQEEESFFNMETGEIVFENKNLQSDTLIKTSDVFSINGEMVLQSLLYGKLLDKGYDKEYIDSLLARFERFKMNIKSAFFHCITIKKLTVNQAIEFFVLMSKQGVAMQEDDIRNALTMMKNT